MDTVLGMVRDWSQTIDAPAMLLVSQWLPILTAASLLPALAARGWLAALAIAGLALCVFKIAPVLAAAGTPENQLVPLLVPVCAWLTALAAVFAWRRDRRARADRAALERTLGDTGHALDRERLWRRSATTGDETIPDDEVQAIVERITERLNAPRGDATRLPG